MPAMPAVNDAQVSPRLEGDCLRVVLSGRWRITGKRPEWAEALSVINGATPARVKLEWADEMSGWDSALVLFVAEAQNWCRSHDAYCDATALPEAVRELVEQLAAAQLTRAETASRPSHGNIIHTLGELALRGRHEAEEILAFVGECALGALYFVRHPGKFRWRDCLWEMQQCGAMALPIVSLISFLVGVTLAYTGALVLRQVGGDIWIADIIGLSMVREMGAVMAAVVLAGRTGAAFAATLGNMKAGEEIDALETLGIRPVNFLVLPRVVALGLMMPLLALYANLLGILGGVAVALGVLGIPPAAFWVELVTAVSLRSVQVGVIKAATFGLLVGLAGCLRGLQAERSAAGVGRAATSAVVTALLLLICADAVFAVVFNVLGW